tara:strand:+ start:34326 stop:34526 length:201 start_codon:yes stop_codon:yes gene_type:complete
MIPVEGHKHLFRDENTGAIINDDKAGYAKYMALKEKKSLEKEELDSLRRDIDEIKSLLKEMVKNPS